MTTHASLTGAELHEPKGVSTASANTSYIADGAGSGTWSKIGPNQIDSSTVKNVNKFHLTLQVPALATATIYLVPLTANCMLTLATGALSGVAGGAGSTITVTKKGGFAIGTMVVGAADAAGTLYTITPVSNNTFVATDYIQFSNNASGGAANISVTIHLEFTLT